MELSDIEMQIAALGHALNTHIGGMSRQKSTLKSHHSTNASLGPAIELLEQQATVDLERNATVCAALQYVIDDLKQQKQNKSRTRFEKALLRHEIAGLEARKRAMCNYSA